MGSILIQGFLIEFFGVKMFEMVSNHRKTVTSMGSILIHGFFY